MQEHRCGELRVTGDPWLWGQQQRGVAGGGQEVAREGGPGRCWVAQGQQRWGQGSQVGKLLQDPQMATGAPQAWRGHGAKACRQQETENATIVTGSSTVQHGRAGVMPRGAGSTLGCSGRSLLPWSQHPPGGCPVLSPSHSHWVLLWDQQRPCPCLPEPHRTLHPQKNWHPLLSTTLQPHALPAGSEPCLYPVHPLPVQAAACWVLGICHTHQPCWPHTYRSQRWSSSSPACRGAGGPSARPVALPAPAGSAACLAPTGGMKGDVAVWGKGSLSPGMSPGQAWVPWNPYLARHAGGHGEGAAQAAGAWQQGWAAGVPQRAVEEDEFAEVELVGEAFALGLVQDVLVVVVPGGKAGVLTGGQTVGHPRQGLGTRRAEGSPWDGRCHPVGSLRDSEGCAPSAPCPPSPAAPERPAQLVIVHLGFAFPLTPQPGHLLRVFDDKLPVLALLPGDDMAKLFLLQQLQDEMP